MDACAYIPLVETILMQGSNSWKEHLVREDEFTLRIRKHGLMKVDAMLVSDEAHWSRQSDDRSPGQLVNSACLPGAVGEAWGMADWHFGYGFPIGGVVATDVEHGDEGGAISPGGVGFDINCGVRLLTLDVSVEEIQDMKSLSADLAKAIPAGASGKGGVPLTESELDSIVNEGASAAIDMGWGQSEDLPAIESLGMLENEGGLSQRARQRGMKSLGTLGSGNHFLELQVVDKTVDEETAASFGLFPGQVCMMIHSGSRGLGHQVCSEHVDAMEREYSRSDGNLWSSERWGWTLPDRQLAAAPVHSRMGQSYLEAMNAAANFAFANRSALAQRARMVLKDHLGVDGEASLLYDVCHNIAKVENHIIDGRNCNCCVHRKGATRAFSGDSEIHRRFENTGQPVMVPGDMGTASWILSGPMRENNRAFGSSCHGAGRALSRTAARKTISSESLMESLSNQGIEVHAKTRNILSEEAPDAYKDVDEVIRLTAGADLARPVARLRPLAVIKG